MVVSCHDIDILWREAADPWRAESIRKSRAVVAATREGDLAGISRGAFRPFICICIYLFFEYTKPEQSYPGFDLLPFLRLSVLGALVGYFVDKQSKIGSSALNWLIVLFLLQCVVSAYYAYDPSYAFSHLNIVETWAVVFFLVSGIVNSERRLFLFLIVYLLCNPSGMSQFGFL